jgi:hypothetical protein
MSEHEHLLARIERQLQQIDERITKLMTTQAQLDATIAGLPGLIETAVETALQPVIAAIQAAAAANGVDLTNEVNSLNAIPATVASAVATAVTPPAPPTT